MATLGFTETFGAYATGPVHAAEPPCPIGKSGQQLVRSAAGAICDVDSAPHSAETQKVLAAKQAYVDADTAFTNGTGSQQRVDAAKIRLEAVTGEKLSSKSSGPSPLASLVVPSYVQINGNYCGSATVENILKFFGILT